MNNEAEAEAMGRAFAYECVDQVSTYKNMEDAVRAYQWNLQDSVVDSTSTGVARHFFDIALEAFNRKLGELLCSER